MSASSHRIYFLLQRAAHLIKCEADAALTEVAGLTTAQSAAMGIIISDGPTTQKHIAHVLSQRESAVATMATRLLKAGYITRTRSRDDARAWQLEATPAGRKAVAQMQDAFNRINTTLDDAIPAREMTRLADQLTKVISEFSPR